MAHKARANLRPSHAVKAPPRVGSIFVRRYGLRETIATPLMSCGTGMVRRYPQRTRRWARFAILESLL